jgi:hypothetical protein
MLYLWPQYALIEVYALYVRLSHLFHAQNYLLPSTSAGTIPSNCAIQILLAFAKRNRIPFGIESSIRNRIRVRRAPNFEKMNRC